MATSRTVMFVVIMLFVFSGGYEFRDAHREKSQISLCASVVPADNVEKRSFLLDLDCEFLRPSGEKFAVVEIAKDDRGVYKSSSDRNGKRART